MEVMDDLPSFSSSGGSPDWAGGGEAADGLAIAVREALLLPPADDEVGPRTVSRDRLTYSCPSSDR
jgi:hypothetical protein